MPGFKLIHVSKSGALGVIVFAEYVICWQVWKNVCQQYKDESIEGAHATQICILRDTRTTHTRFITHTHNKKNDVPTKWMTPIYMSVNLHVSLCACCHWKLGISGQANKNKLIDECCVYMVKDRCQKADKYMRGVKLVSELMDGWADGWICIRNIV